MRSESCRLTTRALLRRIKAGLTRSALPCSVAESFDGCAHRRRAGASTEQTSLLEARRSMHRASLPTLMRNMTSLTGNSGPTSDGVFAAARSGEQFWPVVCRSTSSRQIHLLASSRALVNDGTSSYDALQLEFSQRCRRASPTEINYSFQRVHS